MNKNDENMDWEKEAPFLASLPRTMPYRVPDKYFDQLQLHINQAVFVDGLMQKDNQGFSVPQNYFEELSLQIEDRIAIDQLQSIVATDGFKIPEGYFDKLQANILSQTSESRPKPKTIKLWQSDFMKYVSAACFIVLAASGLYLNQQSVLKQDRKVELANEQMLYDIDESVIIEHLEESQTANTTSASDTEMENYILNHFSSNDLSNNL